MKKDRNFKSTIIISIMIHVIFFTVGFCRVFKNQNIDEPKFIKDGLAINAVIIDPEIAIENYKLQTHQKKNVNSSIEEQKKQKKRKIKEVSKKNKKIENKTKEFLKSKNKPTKEYKKKDTPKSAKKLDVENIESFNGNERQKKSSKIIRNIKKNDKLNKVMAVRNGTVQHSSTLSTDITNYANQIKEAIESRFYNVSYYSGKTCTLRINLAPDGTIIDIHPEGGDPFLCNAALSAARHAKIPTPPSSSVYEFFKNALLDFKP